MTKRTRYFLSVSSGILLLGLCAGAVAYYGGLAPVAEGQAQTSRTSTTFRPTRQWWPTPTCRP